MSDFLTRLVQRTRGEAAVVRPVSHAVTSPDPTGAAWDEQIAVREAPPLARAPHAALPPLQVPVAAVAVAPSVPAPLSRPDPHRELERASEVQVASIAASDAAPAIADSASSQTAASPLALETLAASLPSAAPRVTVPQPTVASQTVARQTDPRQTVALPLTPAVRTPPAAPAAPLVPARESKTHSLAESIAARLPSVAAPPSPRPPSTPVALAPAQPAQALAAEPAPTPARPAPLAAAAAFGVAAPGQIARPVDDPAQLPSRSARRAAETALREHSTRVEVSIGRIEVRLPARPRKAADETPSLAQRRAPVGLAEYLASRETGKSR
jgi:hypothetical protein